jgi:hypothetical protein
MSDPSITSSLQDAISRELECDEKVVWSAMPKPTYFSEPAAGVFRSGLGLTTVSVLFTAISIGFVPGFDSLDLFFLIGGLGFFFWGITMISAPLWAFRRSLKTVYVITDRRAITVVGGWSTTIRSYPPEKLTRIDRRENQDGTGDVIISRPAWRDPETDHRMPQLGFLRISDAESVEATLRKLAGQRDESEARKNAESWPQA